MSRQIDYSEEAKAICDKMRAELGRPALHRQKVDTPEQVIKYFFGDDLPVENFGIEHSINFIKTILDSASLDNDRHCLYYLFALKQFQLFPIDLLSNSSDDVVAQRHRDFHEALILSGAKGSKSYIRVVIQVLDQVAQAFPNPPDMKDEKLLSENYQAVGQLLAKMTMDSQLKDYFVDAVTFGAIRAAQAIIDFKLLKGTSKPHSGSVSLFGVSQGPVGFKIEKSESKRLLCSLIQAGRLPEVEFLKGQQWYPLVSQADIQQAALDASDIGKPIDERVLCCVRTMNPDYVAPLLAAHAKRVIPVHDPIAGQKHRSLKMLQFALKNGKIKFAPLSKILLGLTADDMSGLAPDEQDKLKSVLDDQSALSDHEQTLQTALSDCSGSSRLNMSNC